MDVFILYSPEGKEYRVHQAENPRDALEAMTSAESMRREMSGRGGSMRFTIHEAPKSHFIVNQNFGHQFRGTTPLKDYLFIRDVCHSLPEAIDSARNLARAYGAEVLLNQRLSPALYEVREIDLSGLEIPAQTPALCRPYATSLDMEVAQTLSPAADTSDEEDALG